VIEEWSGGLGGWGLTAIGGLAALLSMWFSRKEMESFERASGLNEIPIRCIVSCFFCSCRVARHGKQVGR
jgi:hypothetical protein